jgi:hypothetical protein
MARVKLLAFWLICQGAHFVASLWLFVAILINSSRAWRIILAYDRLGNAATGGSDTETISSRANRGTVEGNRGWCLLCWLLDRIQKGHCKNSAGT